MDNYRRNSLSGRFLLIVAVVGIAMRLSLIRLGHNFDFESFLNVARLARLGANIYASFERYNYGPVWFSLLRLFYSIASVVSSNPELAFRYILVFFLSLVDTGIAIVLWKKLNLTAAVAFFLNPISLIITGYHNQFDNVALLLGLLSVILFGDDFDKPLNRRKLLGLGVLGLSLMTKHILFAFPLWLAVKQKGLRNKLAVIVLPTLIFFAGFVPFWGQGKDGIMRNVFLYRSNSNTLFYRLFVPWAVRMVLSGTIVWLILLAVSAFVFRRKSGFDTLVLYTCVFMATSPALVNQYLAIPLLFIVANLNAFSTLYTAIGTLHLLVHEDGLHIQALRQVIPISAHPFFSVLIGLLLLDLVWLTWREYLTAFFRGVLHEVAVQLGREE